MAAALMVLCLCTLVSLFFAFGAMISPARTLLISIFGTFLTFPLLTVQSVTRKFFLLPFALSCLRRVLLEMRFLEHRR